MKRLHGLLLGLAVLLAAMGGLASWAIAQHGYPNAVYYEEATQISNGSRLASSESTLIPDGAQLLNSKVWIDPHVPVNYKVWLDPQVPLINRVWIDPQSTRIRVTSDAGPFHSEVLTRDGRRYGAFFFQRADSGPEPAAAWAAEIRLYRRFQPGFGGYGHTLLAQAVGPVVQVQLAGRVALRFRLSKPDAGVQDTLWLDARTLAPLQRQLADASESVLLRYSRLEQLPPGSLPADFFDPPNRPPTAWDRAMSWVQAHLRS